jgi:predicted transcriptional regulator
MSKFTCPYLYKWDIDMDKLNEKASRVDIKEIASILDVSAEMTSMYLSTKDQYIKIKIPQDFIDLVISKYEIAKELSDSIAKQVNDKLNS